MKRLFALRRRYPKLKLAELARRLNTEGYTTKLGKPFTNVQVKRILDRRDLYRGIYRYASVKTVGLHPAILKG